jgi:tRNA uridine 5-carboxymethylaminomethyl modification enzyme
VTAHKSTWKPEGIGSESIYVNGLSMSLPADVQHEVVRSMPGLENSKVIRPGYAVEYDFVQPTDLKHTLECRHLPGLFLAGQINGTSGYEEAGRAGAGGGLSMRRGSFIGKRGWSSTGTSRTSAFSSMTSCRKAVSSRTGCSQSRAEHRLVLRIDNADLRLTPVGRQLGLVSDARWAQFEDRRGNTMSQPGIAADSRRLTSDGDGAGQPGTQAAGGAPGLI